MSTRKCFEVSEVKKIRRLWSRLILRFFLKSEMVYLAGV